MTPGIAATGGFYGKIPSRGDFVGAGLPTAVTRTWDRWVSTAVAAAQASFGESWAALWFEAPVWRFALPAGLCGDAPLLGLWMPSIDKAGRHFPLMIAAACPTATALALAGLGGGWLDTAEDAGRDALEFDLSPDALLARLPPPPEAADESGIGILPHGMAARVGAGYWWTDGGPHVAPTGYVLPALPDNTTFAAMLRDVGSHVMSPE